MRKILKRGKTKRSKKRALKKQKKKKEKILLLGKEGVTCRYCKNFNSNKKEPLCLLYRKKRKEDSPACINFDRVERFFCIENNCRILFKQCVHRRRIGLCEKCYQFDKEIDFLVNRRLVHRPKNSLLAQYGFLPKSERKKKKKKRRLGFTPLQEREMSISLGRKMRERFGTRDWMRAYPEIFAKPKPKHKRTLKKRGRKICH